MNIICKALRFPAIGMLALLLLSSAPGSKTAWAADASPQQFEYFFGNLMFGYESLELKDHKLLYTNSSPGGKTTREIKVSDAQWQTLRGHMDKLKVWGWQPSYVGSLMDGTQWHLKLTYADKKLDAKGSNAFPDETGAMAKPGDDVSQESEYFKQVLTAIRQTFGITESIY